MDPLAHTLTGAALAATPLARGTRLAIPTLLIAANLPDIDALSHFWGSDCALYFRRGWTHGVPALIIFSFVLAAIMTAVARLQNSKAYQAVPPLKTGRILLLSAVGVVSHPLLDWLNTYGVRFLMPFDGQWVYGDVLFIVDLGIWLILGGTCFFSWSKSAPAILRWSVLAALATAFVFSARVPVPDLTRVVWLLALVSLAFLRFKGLPASDERSRERYALIGVCLFLSYLLLQTGASTLAYRMVEVEVRGIEGQPLQGLMVGPLPGNPFTRDVVAAFPGHYRTGRFYWFGRERLVWDKTPIPRREPSPVIAKALEARSVRGFVQWVRFPFYEVEELNEGFRVFILDARYVRSRQVGFGGRAVDITREAVQGR